MQYLLDYEKKYPMFLALQKGAFITSYAHEQCTVVGGGDKISHVHPKRIKKIQVCTNFLEYFERKSVFKHFQNINNPL